MLAAVALAYGWAAKAGYPEDQIRAIGFAAIVFGNVFLILAARSSDRSIIATLMRPNPALWWVIIATIAALALVLYVPPVAELFRLQALGPGALLTALAAGGVALLSVEAVKLLRRVGRAS
ncbi:MAG: cation transporting ATPase C-terminal domain-containing protein, partial [Burkholderiales bacterium]